MTGAVCRAPHCWHEYGTPCATCPAVCDATNDCQYEAILGRLVAWADKWPSDRVYGGGDIERVAAEIDSICEAARAALASPEARTHERVTHGRHCTCTPCRDEDWTQPHLAPCGMHGSECPPEYQPLGGAGEYVALTRPEART